MVFVTLDALAPYLTTASKPANELPGALACLGATSLPLAVFADFLVKDLRKWKTTRTVKLKIYEKGLTYESQWYSQSCYWNEIYDFTHATVEIKVTKTSPPKKISVIKSIIKKDRTPIILAETLDLQKITKLLKEARKSSKAS